MRGSFIIALSERVTLSGTACQKRAYTKGARAEPSLRMIRADKRTSMMMIGASQYFFLYRKNSQNSTSIVNLLMSFTR